MSTADTTGGHRRPVIAAVLVAALAIALLPLVAATGGAQESDGAVPVPEVTGPLPTSDESHPFGGAAYQSRPQDLARWRYVEEEFLQSATANVYSWPENAPAEIVTPDAPYTTRALVRRPADPHDFSGRVVVEMLNPSNLFDLNIGWALAFREIVDNGDAWVGITAKPIAVDALQTFDPERYAALSFANPLPLDDPANCTEYDADADPSTPPVPLPDDTSRDTENGLVWDMFTHTANWVRSDAASNPLRYDGDTTRVAFVYGFGYSQTGGYLVNYTKAIHPLVVEAQGASAYDAYMIGVAGGGFAGAYPMNQCEPRPPTGDPRRDLYGIGVPVMQLMSQSDYLLGIGSRRPDSDTEGDRFRHHEMAGAGHATPDELYYSARPEDILQADRDVPPLACDQGPRSRLPSSIFFDAGLDNLQAWVEEGVEPPSTDPIVVRYREPLTDRFGNVRGGWRSPYLEVPTSTWFGSATGASFCFIAGYEEPFDDALLDELYDSTADYARQVRRSAHDLVKERLLTPYDARRIIRAAWRADMP